MPFDVVRFRTQAQASLAGSAKYKGIARNAALARFTVAQQEMLEEFDEHPVTKEIQEGPEGANITNTLGGKGNLFSFIGFHESDEPTKDLRDTLDRDTQLAEKPEIELTPRQILFKFHISTPSEEEIEEAAPYPDQWDIGSWALDIERAISGINQYVYHEHFGEQSRSSTGLQDKRRDIPGVFRPIKYISTILKNFEKKF